MEFGIRREKHKGRFIVFFNCISTKSHTGLGAFLLIQKHNFLLLSEDIFLVALWRESARLKKPTRSAQLRSRVHEF